MSNVDLASEMAAARKRRTEQTARAIRDARVLAVRTVIRPGSTREDIEGVARSFYPRLSDELVNEVTEIVWDVHRGRAAREADAAAAEAAADPEVPAADPAPSA